MKSIISVGDVVEWSVVALATRPRGVPAMTWAESCLRQTQAAETATEQHHNVNVTVNDSVKQTIMIAARQPRDWPGGFDVREHLSNVV